jgi:hypothetical protein
MVRGSTPGEDEIFHTYPDLSWGPSSLLYHGYRVCFPGGKAVGTWARPPTPPFSAEAEERVDLHLYSSSWPVLEWASLYLYIASFDSSILSQSIWSIGLSTDRCKPCCVCACFHLWLHTHTLLTSLHLLCPTAALMLLRYIVCLSLAYTTPWILVGANFKLALMVLDGGEGGRTFEYIE